MPNMNTEPQEIKSKIQAALIANLYSEVQAGLVASVLGSFVLVIGLYPVVDHSWLIAWFSIFMLICVIREITFVLYYRDVNPEKNYIKWRRIFVVNVFVAGAAWGFVSSVLFPYPHMIQVILIVLLMTGVAAGSVASLCSQYTAVLAFLLPALVPLCIRLTFIGDRTLFLAGFASYIYLAFLIAIAFKSHRMTKNSISLQFQNAELLHDLSQAKTDLEKINKKIIHSATHDALTNLANRNVFDKRFEEIVENANNQRKSLALLHLNIDGFKEVNEIYGHQIGNILLQRIAERVRSSVTRANLLARLGSDEFVVVCENVTEVQSLIDLAQKICTVVSIPLELESFNLLVTISIGISVFPIDGHDVETLFRSADQTLRKVKDAGGNNFKFSSDLKILRNSLAH